MVQKYRRQCDCVTYMYIIGNDCISGKSQFIVIKNTLTDMCGELPKVGRRVHIETSFLVTGNENRSCVTAMQCFPLSLHPSITVAAKLLV